MFFSVMTKNSNWEILLENLVSKDKIVLRMKKKGSLKKLVFTGWGVGVHEKPI